MAVFNPPIPYVGFIEGGFNPGRMVKIQGHVPHESGRFSVNLQAGPMVNPRDDMALHIHVNFHENFILRNSLIGQHWGNEEKHGHIPFVRGQPFEMLILCEANQYKIAINGQHFAEFHHRMPYHLISYLTIDGEVQVGLIQYEGGPMMQGTAAPLMGMPVGPPHIGGPNVHTVTIQPVGVYPPVYGAQNYEMSQSKVPYPPASASNLPYPSTATNGALPYPPSGTPSTTPYPSVVPTPTPYPSGVPYPSAGFTAVSTQPAGYPSSTTYPQQQSGYPSSNTQSKGGIDGLIGKAGKYLGGAGLLSLAAGAGAKHGGLMRGMGLPVAGAAAGGAAMYGSNPKKQLKQQRKAQKKALKYGIPVAALGVGGLAVAHGMHKKHKKHKHHGHSSSSSSSSSE